MLTVWQLSKAQGCMNHVFLLILFLSVLSVFKERRRMHWWYDFYDNVLFLAFYVEFEPFHRSTFTANLGLFNYSSLSKYTCMAADLSYWLKYV